MGKNKFKRRGGPSLEDRKTRMREMKRQLVHEERKNKSGADKPKFTVDQLLDKAENCINMFEYELAQKFCQRALEMEPDNIRALETAGELLIELNQLESAKQCFGRAVAVCPDKGYTKYMNLGQLFEGAQAVECFQKGIELMLVEKSKRESQEIAAACGSRDEEEEEEITDQSISDAYLSIAELYMTDLCDEPDASEKCKECVDKALAVDKDNPDAWRVQANLYLLHENKEGARESMKKSVDLWLPQYQASDVPGANVDAPFECPVAYGKRINTGKTLIEVEEYELAVEVLETLLEEDDEVVDVWYLIGYAYYNHGDKDNARSYLSKARKVHKKVKSDDSELVEHVKSLLSELGEGKDEIASDAEAEDDDEWEDIDSEDEEEVGEEKDMRENGASGEMEL